MLIGHAGEVLAEIKDKCVDFTKDGKCSGCGKCCSANLPLTDSEIDRIRKYIKRNGIQEQRHIVPTKKATLDMTCPFLMDSKEKDRCAIYPVRPLICRIFCCNQPIKEILANRDELWSTRRGYNMRQLFFGKKE